MGESARIGFVSAVVSKEVPVRLVAPDDHILTISNCCIPDLDPAAPESPARLFGKLMSSSDQKLLLATLVPNRSESEMIGFRVPPGDSVILEASGPHSIHLIGYLHPLDEDGSNGEENEEEEEEEADSS
jgi:hypothetical protein